MKVCILSEGCYPYITGGVSTWIHQIISGMPDIEFKILSIMPSYKEQLQYKYSFPDNVSEVKTVFLDDYLKSNHSKFHKPILFTDQEKENFIKLLRLDPCVDWKQVVRLISIEKKIGNALDFLQSEFFWDTIVKYYSDKYNGEKFNTFFWTIRAMLLPFITLLHHEAMDADVFHAVSTGYAGILGLSFHETKQKPFLLTEHGIYAREREEEIIKAQWVTGVYKKLWIDFFYFLSIAAYKEADLVISLFERNRDIQIEMGAPKELTRVIPNSVDLKRFSAAKEKHEGYNIGAILRVVPIKDVMTLIRAFKVVKTEVHQAKLYIIGPEDEDPVYYRQCQNLIGMLKISEDVVFTGSVDVKQYLPKMDVLVLTSISEGQPMVILEGMASGIPIVASDVGACREQLQENRHEGPCGLVTRMASPNDTAAELIKLYRDPQLRENMGRNGRLRAERDFDKDEFLKTYKQIYMELG
ncbi:GT4 family glycosyltransferase PelF [Phosphitispora sp. TUW77]|uniref:GT4 family glycosyltransferase PelF n=1 Tax=Phosphitispora sp. TUW77 TaxID=3152361 RepID=UPI003AB4F755